MVKNNHGTAIFRRVLLSLFVVILLLNLVLALHAWKFTHFYDDPGLRKPHPTGLLATTLFILAGEKIPKRLNDSLPAVPHEIFKLRTTENLQLEGWRLPATESIGEMKTGPAVVLPPKGSVIMFHGHGSCKSSILPEAHQFLQLGYDVYMIDFRAHGNSEGQQCLIGMKETADVKAVYDYVLNRGEKNIVLFGVSMGAATIIKTVHDYAISPSKIILEMPFASLLDGTKGKLRLMGLPGFLARPLAFWGGTLNGKWAFSYKPYLMADSIKCPVLLQWGRQDPRVTAAETNQIFKHLNSPKKLVIYENSGHESLFKNEPAKWRATVTPFLQ